MGRISYLLDSNILSEPARLTPNDNVLQQQLLSGMNWFMAVSYWQHQKEKNNSNLIWKCCYSMA